MESFCLISTELVFAAQFAVSHFEIHILNFNGARFLPLCLESLRDLKLGSHSVTVNVVDNGSTDQSKDLVVENFPEVNFLELGENFGFSKGNNLGVKHRQEQLASQGKSADFHVLLNSDTAVDPEWLLEAASAFNAPEVGIVGSKALFMDKFAELSIESLDAFVPLDYGSSDSRRLGIFMHCGCAGTNIRNLPGRLKFPDAYPRQGIGMWLKPEARLLIPIANPLEESSFSFYLENHHPDLIESRVLLKSKTVCRELIVTRGHPYRATINFAPHEYRDFVQNAGSYVTSNWSAGDLGFLEPDSEKHNIPREVTAVCGVSMFIRDKLWRKLGGFDERYFAYYEDTDLSLRAQMLGYRCFYAPKSKLLHIHAGSGIEFSDYFNRNVAWSHLVFSSKMMDRSQWKRKLKNCKTIALRELQAYSRDGNLSSKPHLVAYCKYLKQFPHFLKNRWFNYSKRPSQYLSDHLNQGA